MARGVFTVDLMDDPAVIQAYREHHRRVWPEVLMSLRRVGIRTMAIHILGRRLVMIVESDGRDLRRCFAAHRASDARVAEWEALMKSMQEPVPGSTPGDWWALMEPLFELDVADATRAAESARPGRGV